MDEPIIVPVVAHRVFGTRYVPRPVRTRRRTGLQAPLPQGISPLAGNILVMPTVDESHGTRRSLDDVRALFHEGGAPEYARGWSVNRVWADTGVQFLLVGVADQRIDSDRADLLPSDTRDQPDFTTFNYPGTINVYCCRFLEGAWGVEKSDQTVVLGDRWAIDESTEDREDSWRHEVITLAHELGHALTLPHTNEPANVMYGCGTLERSIGLTASQALVSRQHARIYSRPWFRFMSDPGRLHESTVEVPLAHGYAGERLPAFV